MPCCIIDVDKLAETLFFRVKALTANSITELNNHKHIRRVSPNQKEKKRFKSF